MRDYIKTISDYGSGERAWQLVNEITTYHRIQCSTGFRAAAQHCCQVLRRQGIEAEVRQYPSDEQTWYWTSKCFLEWDCREATCDLVEPHWQRLADFAACPNAVMQKSFPCDYRRQPLEIVLMDKGCDPENYRDVDLKGKLLFLREPFAGYMGWAFGEKGAVGFITDYMREVPGVRSRADLYDITNYTSFWWKDSTKEPHIFGFVLSPRKGDQLAALCRRLAEEGKRPKAACYVDASLYPGYLENVEAFLPGETEEEIQVIAHLCHPRPSANDNASGSAVAMELLKTLKDLTDSGRLPPLRRGVRVCLVPEFSGTYPYLCRREDELGRIVAGINLDMVGGRQGRGYGPLVISDQPWSGSPLVTAVADLVLDEVKRQSEVHKKGNYVPLFNAAVGQFTTGSDHIILSDPAVGIPCPMLGQWPDLNYHTSGDTVEQVDPAMLHHSLVIAAGYVYALANFGPQEAAMALRRIRSRYERALEDVENSGGGQAAAKVRAVTRWAQEGCRQVARYAPEEERPALARAAEDAAQSIAARGQEALGGLPPQAEVQEAPAGYIPVRRFMGPIVHLDDYALGDPAKEAAYKAYTAYQAELVSASLFETLLIYAMDGRRTVDEAIELAQLEAGEGSRAMGLAFCDLLELYGILEKKRV